MRLYKRKTISQKGSCSVFCWPTILILFIVFAALPAAADEGPAIWRFGDDDTTIYLFGTIHLMKEDVNWFTEEVESAFTKADTLVLEIDQTELSQEEQQETVGNMAILPEGESLSEIVSEKHMKELYSLLEPLGIPRNAVQRWKPWYAGLLVINIAAQNAGFYPQFGVETTLLQKAKAAGKEVSGLETFTEQLSLFNDLARDEAIYFLKNALDEQEELGNLFSQLKDSWLEEDFAALENLLLESEVENKSFHEKVYLERNREWAEQITEMLEKPRTFFIAVGAAHMVGEESLISLLEDRGYNLREKDKQDKNSQN